MMFSETDLRRIREAVQAAERRTRGEIVPMVVPVSARYREARHLGGLVTALLALGGLLSLDLHWAGWGWSMPHPAWIVLGVAGAYGLGSYVGSWPWGIRLFTPRDRMTLKVRLRAERAFHELGLHRTREGTGVLILLSLLERRVQILADRAINDRVPPGTWDALVNDLVQGIRDGRAADALCAAIARCGDLLAVHFPARPGDNPDELPNELVQRP